MTSLEGLRGLLFLANYGSDPTETAIPWQILTEAGVKFDVATETGQVSAWIAVVFIALTDVDRIFMFLDSRCRQSYARGYHRNDFG